MKSESITTLSWQEETLQRRHLKSREEQRLLQLTEYIKKKSYLTIRNMYLYTKS